MKSPQCGGLAGHRTATAPWWVRWAGDLTAEPTAAARAAAGAPRRAQRPVGGGVPMPRSFPAVAGLLIAAQRFPPNASRQGNAFLYPSGALEWEFAFVFMYRIIEYFRCFQASKANKTETIVPMLWSFVLAVATIIFNIYYLREQTYVLRLDVVLNGISLVFISLEVLIGLATVFSFYKAW